MVTWKKRSELKPGEMFVVPNAPWTQAYWQDVWVVLDAKSEVGFWRGAQAVHGDVCPSRMVLCVWEPKS